MPSDKEFLNYVLDRLSDLEDITYRYMMREYIIYYKGRIAGGIYDNRLLVKPTKSAAEYMSEAKYELPYEGGKEMLAVDNIDDKDYLTGLFEAMFDELLPPKTKKKKS